DEGVKLPARQIAPVRLPVEAQLERAGKPVVAADLGCAIAAPKGRATEIELLGGVERTGRGLARHRYLGRECVVQRLVARVVEIQLGESRRGAEARYEIVAGLRGAPDVETLAINHRRVVGAAKIVLQSVVRCQADGADLVIVVRAEHVAFP